MNLPLGFSLHLRKVRKVGFPTSSVAGGEKDLAVKVATDVEIPPSAPSAPVLVPLDATFVDGCRYRQADALEATTRLDLYVQDATGPWRRTMGVLVWAGGGLRKEEGIRAHP